MWKQRDSTAGHFHGSKKLRKTPSLFEGKHQPGEAHPHYIAQAAQAHDLDTSTVIQHEAHLGDLSCYGGRRVLPPKKISGIQGKQSTNIKQQNSSQFSFDQRKFRRETSELRKVAKRVRAGAWREEK